MRVWEANVSLKCSTKRRSKPEPGIARPDEPLQPNQFARSLEYKCQRYNVVVSLYDSLSPDAGTDTWYD